MLSYKFPSQAFERNDLNFRYKDYRAKQYNELENMPAHGMDGPPLEKMDASKTQVSACAGWLG